MNIWWISKYVGIPKYGAPGARLFFLAREFVKMGHKVFVITSDSNHLANYPKTTERYNCEEIEGVPVCWIKTKKYRKSASVSRILSWLDFERWLFLMDTERLDAPDVVVVSSLSLLTILYGLYLKRKYGAFLVFEVRDIWPLTAVEDLGVSRWNPVILLLGWVERIGYKKSDLIVGTMPRLGLHVEEVLGYKRPVFISPLGFDPERYKGDVAENPFDDVFPKGKMIIGYAGSMGRTNALETFVEAVKLLKDEPDIHFALMGDGDLRKKFERELSGCHNVTFLPKVEQEKVRFFLAKCDVLYLSAKDSKVWQYGQSMNKIVEYMVAGKPIIASYTGYPSMINEAKCGVFVPNRDPEALKDIFLRFAKMDKSELKRMGENGKRWIYKHRTYSTLARKYIDIITSMLKN